MHQETADKLFVAECDLALGISGFLSSCREGHFCFGNRKDPVVGECNFVSIASQILNGIAKSVEGLFDVWAPVHFIKAVFPLFPVIGITQLFAGRRKYE